MELFKVFNFENDTVRIRREITDDEESVWFNCHDVGNVLGLAHIDTSLPNIPDKYISKFSEIIKGRTQDMNYIEEIGLYMLINRSRVTLCFT